MSEPFFRKFADAPTGGAAAAPSVSEQLLKISELYKAGVLSDAEYAAATKRAESAHMTSGTEPSWNPPNIARRFKWKILGIRSRLVRTI